TAPTTAGPITDDSTIVSTAPTTAGPITGTLSTASSFESTAAPTGETTDDSTIESTSSSATPIRPTGPTLTPGDVTTSADTTYETSTAPVIPTPPTQTPDTLSSFESTRITGTASDESTSGGVSDVTTADHSSSEYTFDKPTLTTAAEGSESLSTATDVSVTCPEECGCHLDDFKRLGLKSVGDGPSSVSRSSTTYDAAVEGVGFGPTSSELQREVEVLKTAVISLSVAVCLASATAFVLGVCFFCYFKSRATTVAATSEMRVVDAEAFL
ncbi:MAG: hypothetical protein KVP17_002828, partial [Porospora cf. gigantea B]